MPTTIMTKRILKAQNRAFSGTGGVSSGCRSQGFVPGFLDQETGAVYPSRFRNGCPAPVHVLDGLPEHLVLERAPGGRVLAVHGSVIAGFIKDGCFFTREQVAALI